MVHPLVDIQRVCAAGRRQVADGHLLTLARRRGVRLQTFDAAIVSLAQGHDVELLITL
jgi:hypothetical protein